MEEKKRGFKEWAKAHKKVLVITALGVVATTATVLVYLAIQNKEEARNIEDKLHNAIKDVSQNIQETAKEIGPIVQTQTKRVLPPGFLDHLTGQQFTATGLGRLVGCSNREINRRIVDAGLAIRVSVNRQHKLPKKQTHLEGGSVCISSIE